MQQTFFRAICQTGIFMICAQAIIHFRSKEVYEKYLKFLVSAMVLIQLFLPIGSFIWGKGGEGAAQALEQFRSRLNESMESAEESAAAADNILEQMTLEEVRRRMEAQQEESVEAPEGENSEEDLGEGTETFEGTGKIEIELEVEPVEPVSIGN